MNNIRIVFLSLVVLIGTSVSCALAQEASLTRPVSAIEIYGARSFSPEQVQALATLNSALGQRMTLAKVQEDAELLYASGYFSAVSADHRMAPDGLHIIFTVQENPLVTNIAITGNLSLTNNYLAHFMQNKLGSPLNYRTLGQDIVRLNRLFKDAGYDLSQVSDVFFDTETGILYIKVAEPRIGSITYSKTERVRPVLIQRELLSKPGDVFNSLSLREDRSRLLRTGLLGNVSSPLLGISPTPGEVTVHFDLTERKTHQLNFGYGLSSREQFGFVKLSLLNFFEWGETITLRVQSGYELGKEKQTYLFRYYTPWIFEQRRSFAYERYLKLRWENLVEQGVVTDMLEIRRDGWSCELGLIDTAPFYISTEYHEEQVGESQEPSRVNYTKKSIALVNVYNTVKRDLYNNEAEGEYGRLSLEGGGFLGNLFGSDLDLGGRTFGRYELNYSRFLSLSPGQITAVHLESGVFNVAGDALLLEGEQYTCGGSTSVRGYLDIYPYAVGTRRILLNLEYRHSFTDWLQGVIFIDWGNAFDLGPVFLADFRTGRGIGVRFGTPLGPLRFDWAFGDDYTDIFGNDHLSAGEPRNVLHFSLGQTF